MTSLGQWRMLPVLAPTLSGWLAGLAHGPWRADAPFPGGPGLGHVSITAVGLRRLSAFCVRGAERPMTFTAAGGSIGGAGVGQRRSGVGACPLQAVTVTVAAGIPS